jgi:hypothetical protein
LRALSDVRAERGETGRIEIYQDRMWVGRANMAIFNVYVDKKHVGKVPLRSSITIPVRPGTHRVRVRQWYYGSRPLEVPVAAGETVRYRADVPSGQGIRGVARMLFKPSRSLVMVKSDVLSSTGVTPEARSAIRVAPLGRPEDADITAGQAQVRRSVVIGGLIALVGFTLIAIGLPETPALAIVGAVVVAAGLAWNIRTMVQARRLHHPSGNGSPTQS